MVEAGHAVYKNSDPEAMVRLLNPWVETAWALMPDERASALLWYAHNFSIYLLLEAQADLPLDKLLRASGSWQARARASGSSELALMMLRHVWGALIAKQRLQDADVLLWGTVEPLLTQARGGDTEAAREQASQDLVDLVDALYGSIGVMPQLQALAERFAQALGADAAPSLAMARPLAVYHRRLGRGEQAWQIIDAAYRRAQQVLPESQRLRRLLQSEHSILLYERGEVMAALAEHREVAAFWEAQPERHWMRLGRAYNNLARFSHTAGDYRAVLEHAQRAAANSQASQFGLVYAEGMPTRLYEQLARHYLGDAEALERGRAIVDAEGQSSFYALPFTEATLPLAEREGRPDLARWAAEQIKQAVIHSSTPLQANRVMLHLAEARLQPEARGLHQWRALAIGAMGRSPAHQAQALFENAARLSESQASLALAFYKLGARALRRLRSDLPLDSADLQRAGLARYEHHLRNWIGLLIDQGRFKESEQALAFLQEQERGDLLRGPDSPGEGAHNMPNLNAFERGWQSRLDAVGLSLRQASDRIDREIEQQIGLVDRRTVRSRAAEAALAEAVQQLSEAAAQQGEASPNPAGQARARRSRSSNSATLPADSARLRYFLRGEHIALLVERRGQPTRHLKLALGRRELARQTQALRLCLEQRCPQHLTLARPLYQALLAPALRQLRPTAGGRAVQHLQIGADDVLRYLPFAALHDGQRYLVQRYSLSLSGDPASSTVAKSLERAPAWALGMGRSQAGSEAALGPLPAVQRELAALQAETGAQLHLDQDFNTASLRAGLQRRPALVHLASHFVLDPAGRAESYLLLGDGQRLSLSELSHLPWAGVQLAVLSACETALVLGATETSGRGRGRELIGLAASLQSAGVQQLMATQWRVADESTADWLSAFYRQLERSPDGHWSRANLKPELLARAQRRWLRQYQGQPRAHPHFWAAFSWIH